MAARGGGDGTDIGSERRPVRDRKAVSQLKIAADAQPGPSSAPLFRTRTTVCSSGYPSKRA
jgi:hypothetical protein